MLKSCIGCQFCLNRLKETVVNMTPNQCRFARSLLCWSILDLADNADLSIDTIAHYESGDDEYTESVIELIQVALEYGGIEFYAPDDLGVRLRC